MFRILSMLVYFFRELIFDSKEEYDFKSRKFNSKKVLAFVLMLLSFSANAFFMNRIYHLAIDNATLRKEVKELRGEDVKKPPSSPSDSGKTGTIPRPTKPAS